MFGVLVRKLKRQDGSLYLEESSVNGNLHGSYKRWDSGGIIKMYYIDGKRHGVDEYIPSGEMPYRGYSIYGNEVKTWNEYENYLNKVKSTIKSIVNIRGLDLFIHQFLHD